MRKLMNHAAVVTLHCFGVSAGLVAGIWMAGGNFGSGVAEVVAAGLGAAIAVFGAVWISDHREDRARRELRAVVANSVGRILTMAFELRRLCNQPDTTDKLLLNTIRDVLNGWEHLRNFAPYRELGHVEQIQGLANVDLICRRLVQFEEVTLQGPSQASFAIMRDSPRPKQTIGDLAHSLVKECETTLRLLQVDRSLANP